MSTQQGSTLRRPRPHVGDVIARRVSPTALRDAMDAYPGGTPDPAGIGLKDLAVRTRQVDPAGRGVSWQLISFLASDAWWGRDTTTLPTAQLIARALGVAEESLFTREAVASRRKGNE